MPKVFKVIALSSLMALAFAFSASAQGGVNIYTFAESAGAYTALVGTNSTAVGDEGFECGIPIGFDFVFGAALYTHFCISTNGFIRLGDATTTIVAGHHVNELLATARYRPLIAALWDDGNRNTGAITYSTTGAPGSRVLTVDWNNVNIGGGGFPHPSNFGSFQIKIYESTDIVELIYGSTLPLAGSLSASIGLNDLGRFLSVRPGNPAIPDPIVPTNNINSTTNIAGKKYTFTPPPPAPGLLQLSAGSYSGLENSILAANVVRIAGSSGTVGVTYNLTTTGAAVGGAACTAGVDYINPGTQTLSFGNLVTTVPINITLCVDSVTDINETFTITLSDPTGDAQLGSPTSAVVTITDRPPPLSGQYFIPGDYPSLTKNGGIFAALNLSGASDDIIIYIAADLTGESGLHPLNELPDGHSVLIQPLESARTISGPAANAVIILNGADNVTIDGTNGGKAVGDNVAGGDPALRGLTIVNTDSTTPTSAVIALRSGSNGAQGNSILNVNIDGNSPETTFVGISMGGATNRANGANNHLNAVINCRIRRAEYGIFSGGESAANPNNATEILENDLNATGPDRIERVGILIVNESNARIRENRVGGLQTSTGSQDAVGIGVGTETVSVSNTIGGGVTGTIVTRNSISGVNNNNPSGFSAVGIAVAGGDFFNEISNNFVTGVISYSTSPDIAAGIYVVGASGSDTKVYHNSVSMTGDRSGGGSSANQMPSYGLAVTGSNPQVFIFDNVLYTTQTSSTGGTNARSYAIGLAGSAFTNLLSDANGFWSTGPNDGGFRTGSLVAGAGTSHADLSAWRTATALDPDSIEADPSFVNPLTDLHLSGTSSPMRNAGRLVGGITKDYDNESRPNPVDGFGGVPVDIGADEFYGSGTTTLAINDVAQTEGNAGLSQLTFTVTRSGSLTQASSASFTTISGTATGTLFPVIGTDFVNDSGTINFSPGQASVQIPVTIVGDTFFEPDETFTVQLSGPSGTTISDADGLGTIINDDSAPTPTPTPTPSPTPSGPATLSVIDETQAEGNFVNVAFSFQVIRSGSTAEAASASYETVGGSATTGGFPFPVPFADYQRTSGTVTFAPGQTAAQIPVTVIADRRLEPDETFTIQLSNAVGATLIDPTGLGTIANDDTETPPAIALMVNEVDSDTTGSDTQEFVELFARLGTSRDVPEVQIPLDGYVVVLYDGEGDSSYFQAFDLDGLTTDANGYFTIGSSTVPGVDIVIPNNTLQNGADAVAIYFGDAEDFASGSSITTENLQDALVYDTDDVDDSGLLALLNPNQPQINENGIAASETVSMQRCPNGFGGGGVTLSYALHLPTPDTQNTCQSSAASVSGRVLTASGRGLGNVIVSITDAMGASRNYRTSSFGYFSIDNVRMGESHTVRVSAKRYQFSEQTVQVNGDVFNVDFVGTESPPLF